MNSVIGDIRDLDKLKVALLQHNRDSYAFSSAAFSDREL